MTDNAPNSTLTARQEKAVIALLHADSVRQAAEAAEVPERSLYRWLKEPAFDTAYRDARRQSVGQAVARLQQSSGDAVIVLRNIMNDAGKPASVRVAAASKVLDLALKAVELEDLAARLEALEAVYAQKL